MRRILTGLPVDYFILSNISKLFSYFWLKCYLNTFRLVLGFIFWDAVRLLNVDGGRASNAQRVTTNRCSPGNIIQFAFGKLREREKDDFMPVLMGSSWRLQSDIHVGTRFCEFLFFLFFEIAFLFHMFHIVACDRDEYPSAPTLTDESIPFMTGS